MSDWAEESNSGVGYADPGQFRRNMSCFATGVAIVSCPDDQGNVHGMTVNSFTSVSLDPPSVLVCIKPGRMHELLVRSGYFGVSILTESQHAHCSQFSGRRSEDSVADFVVRENVPTLVSCLAWFECEVAQRVEVSDHTVFVARVTACDRLEGAPLMFYQSRLVPAAPEETGADSQTKPSVLNGPPSRA